MCHKVTPGEISGSCYNGRADLLPALTSKLAQWFSVFINSIDDHTKCFQVEFLGNKKFVGLKNKGDNTKRAEST